MSAVVANLSILFTELPFVERVRRLHGLGYAVDYWLGTPPWFLVGGLLLGIVVGMWELAKTVWHK